MAMAIATAATALLLDGSATADWWGHGAFEPISVVDTVTLLIVAPSLVQDCKPQAPPVTQLQQSSSSLGRGLIENILREHEKSRKQGVK